MKTIRSRAKKCIIAIMTASLLVLTLSEATMDVWATTIREVEEDINNIQNELDEINANISDMEDEQDLLEEQMEDLNAEIVNILASIEILREDIAAKTNDIAQTEQEYEAALKKEQDQAEAMTLQISLCMRREIPLLLRCC